MPFLFYSRSYKFIFKSYKLLRNKIKYELTINIFPATEEEGAQSLAPNFEPKTEPKLYDSSIPEQLLLPSHTTKFTVQNFKSSEKDNKTNDPASR